MNIHQTQAHADFLRSIGWQIETRQVNGNRVFAFIRQLGFFPLSLMKLQRVQLHQVDWDWVRALQKKHHVYETVIEADQTSEQPESVSLTGFTTAADFMLTTKTRIVNLHLTGTELLQQMKPKTRYNLHLADKRGLSTRVWQTGEVARDEQLFEQVYGILKENARRINMLLIPKRWIKSQFKCFDQNGFVVGVYDSQESLVAVATYYCSQDTCSYNFNGSTASGRQLMAPTLAVWAGIQEGKRRNLRLFDFDGVYDERYLQQHRFKGFGRFKAGFGGKEVYFPPMLRQRTRPF